VRFLPLFNDHNEDGHPEEAHGEDPGEFARWSRLFLLPPRTSFSDASRCLRASILSTVEQEILEVEQLMDEITGLELNEENVESVLDEIRPYLVGAGGGSIELEDIDGPVVKVHISGEAANVMTVRVSVTQKLREKIPLIAAVQLTDRDD